MLFGSRPNKLASGVRRLLTDGAVGSAEPGFNVDFLSNEYRAAGSSQSLATALTHSRSGNATMTDGYGPELVTNGAFDSNADWTLGTGMAITGGSLVFTSSASGQYARDSGFTVSTSKAYVATLNVTDYTSGTVSVRVSLDDNSNELVLGTLDGRGFYSFPFVYTSGTNAQFNLRSVGATLAVDNVSVREMPVLKWAPHNLFNYSDGSQAQLLGSDTTDAATSIEGFSNSLYFDGDGNLSLKYWSGIPGGVLLTLSVYVELDSGAEPTFPSQAGSPFSFVVGGISPSYVSGYTVTNVSENIYQVSTTIISGSSGSAGIIQHTNQIIPFKATRWQCYRSDLGGMVDNPERGDSYVPTTSAAAYLPRIGHHEFNGYEWVNKGLLAESESRTNLVTDNVDAGSPWLTSNSTRTAGELAPDGTTTAITLANTATAASQLNVQEITVSSGASTFSIFAKAGLVDFCTLRTSNLDAGADDFSSFDLSSGTVFSEGANHTAHMENQGNGWYRIAVTFSTSVDLTGNIHAYMNADGGSVFDADLGANGASSILLWGGQLEAGSVPSSYVPTSGATATRAAETFTVPAANLPWPQPEYIGPELVTNGGFDADSDWTKGTGWTISGGEAVGSSAATLSQPASTTSGTPYLFKFTVSNYSAGTITPNISGRSGPAFTGNGTFEAVIVAAGGAAFNLLGGGGFTGTVDNISVREINPLSVSIAMKGEMDYADTGDTEVVWYDWFASSGNYVQSNLRTQSTATGELYTLQAANSVADDADGRYSQYVPGLNVPFDIASRHGSTFVNGAAGGVALTADTTPTALPDLSAADLDLAYDYMGTIESFRVWDQDLGDSGIEEATAPSLEPSLNLTFDGSGLSFTDTGWTP